MININNQVAAGLFLEKLFQGTSSSYCVECKPHELVEEYLSLFGVRPENFWRAFEAKYGGPWGACYGKRKRLPEEGDSTPSWEIMKEIFLQALE